MNVKLFVLLSLLLLVMACGSKAPSAPESQVQSSAQPSEPAASQDADIAGLTESIQSVDESDLGTEYLDAIDQDLSAVDELE